MKNTRPIRGNRPTPEQELLLRAALLEGEEAIKAWAEWRAAADINEVDFSSFRILPLLHENLSAHGVEDELMGLLKGVRRRFWYKNRLLFHRTAEFLRAMHEAGVRTVLLKGTALSTRYYGDAGLREMGDADVLVPFDEAAAALRLAFARGWKPHHYRSRAVPRSFFHARHAIDLGHPDGYNLDLHWHVLHECTAADADASFWRGAVAAEFEGVPTCVLSPADQLLHTCVHGMTWAEAAELRWVADAMTILKKTPGLDWARLVAETRARALTLAMRETLGYLAETLDAPVPPEVLRQLAETPVTRSERLDYARKTSPVAALGLPTFVRTYAQLYARSTQAASWWRGPREFAEFLRFTWGADSLAELPAQAAMKVIRRARVSGGLRLPPGSASAQP
jgi:hypothetical protein